MLNSPQVVTLSGTATDHHKVSAKETSSQYVSVAGTSILEISHQKTKSRWRHLVKLSQEKIATDPLTSVNNQVSASVHIVLDEPLVGFTDAELDSIATALKTWATSANILAVLTGRH